MNSGPWYEESGPTVEEVKPIILGIFSPTPKFILEETVVQIINDVICAAVKLYGGLGSYRGYYAFTHNNLIKRCAIKINTIRKENARLKIKRFINLYWVQDRLYRPKTESHDAGYGYNQAKLSYYQKEKSFV